jgi:hypothetical protein
MALPSYEKLGVFYLGREIEREGSAPGPDLLYDSRDLTTHAVCIGMTGSGKTGLCVSLLEEAALDGIPAVVIDPKGDLGNLLLTFPDLAPADFKPWVDPGEAARKGQSVEEYAAETATKWREGLAQWGEDGARIQRLREAAEFTIYTPGSTSGRPLSVLRSFAAPPAAGDAAALKERIGSAVSGLLALLGIDADPIKSREHILLAAILDAVATARKPRPLAALIQGGSEAAVRQGRRVRPRRVSTRRKERMELALRIRPARGAGVRRVAAGDALDAQALLYSADGAKPRVSIISIAHLNDAERMFVVTLVANELVAWMRRQPGTTSLRALFYMDEVFGYFPPTAMPPSKTPLLTLMKQARAFGLGVVLATQNPVDLDYKGLGNAGTWFIGRLQTERDQARVIDGLLATDAAAGSDRAALTAQMSKLAQRRFLMRNVHDDAPVLFESRWALSYLRGPLTLAEIQQLTPRSGARSAPAPGSPAPPDTAAPVAGAAAATKPNVQSGVTERYVAAQSGEPTYRPCIGANVRAHFVDAKAGVDAWQSWYYLAPLTADGVDWATAEVLREAPAFGGPQPGARYAATPATALSPRPYASWADNLVDLIGTRRSTGCLSTSSRWHRRAAPGEFRTQLARCCASVVMRRSPS